MPRMRIIIEVSVSLDVHRHEWDKHVRNQFRHSIDDIIRITTEEIDPPVVVYHCNEEDVA